MQRTFSARSRFSTYWREHDLGWQINVSMAFLSIAGLALAFFSSGLIQDFGLNLAFMAVGVFLTVYFVDAAVKRREEKRWSGVDSFAQQSLRRTTTQFLGSISHIFDPASIDRFMITGFEMRVSPELAHLKHARDAKWRQYIQDHIGPKTVGVGYERFSGNHSYLIDAISSYHSRLMQLWPLMSTRWSPEQIENVLELTFQLPVEAELLRVHIQPGVNTRPATLREIIERSLRLIELCNAVDDPSKYVLPNDSP